MFIIEFFNPNRVWKTARYIRFLFHTIVAIINSIILYIPRLILLLPVLLIVEEKQFGLLNNIEQFYFIEVLLGFLFFDFAYYWWHRFNHTVSFLWRFHSFHHLDTHLDVTTSLRFHFGELILSLIYDIFLILIIGAPLEVYIFYKIVLTSSSHFHHSNIQLPNKINNLLIYFFVTPKYHTNHHTVEKSTRNANYTSILTIWDRIFLTYKDSNDVDRTLMGLENRELELDLIKSLKYSFKRNFNELN
tara:strand:- start:1329 stop:2066 length:738 start_codon:yes stop_codon:yes gene_type:complete